MHQPGKSDDVTIPADRPDLLAPDTSGMNFYRAAATQAHSLGAVHLAQADKEMAGSKTD
jgi:hypothetical protein